MCLGWKLVGVVRNRGVQRPAPGECSVLLELDEEARDDLEDDVAARRAVHNRLSEPDSTQLRRLFMLDSARDFVFASGRVEARLRSVAK